MCETAIQTAAYLLVSTTMWSISWEVKKDRNISVGLDETGTFGPVSLVNGSTLTLVRLLDHSSSSSGCWSLLPGVVFLPPRVLLLPPRLLPLPPRPLPLPLPLPWPLAGGDLGDVGNCGKQLGDSCGESGEDSCCMGGDGVGELDGEVSGEDA